jgi:hypothetical protein
VVLLQHGLTRTVSACDGDDPECVFEVSPKGYQDGRWVRLQDGKHFHQSPGTIRVQADHAKSSSWEDDVGDRRSRLSRSGGDGVFRAAVRPARPAFTLQTVHFPVAQGQRQPEVQFEAGLREPAREPLDTRTIANYLSREDAESNQQRVDSGVEEEEGWRRSNAGVLNAASPAAETPGPLQAVATEIARESKKYERLVVVAKAETVRQEDLLAQLEASKAHLRALMDRQLVLARRLGARQEAKKEPWEERRTEKVRPEERRTDGERPKERRTDDERPEERRTDEGLPEERRAEEDPEGRKATDQEQGDSTTRERPADERPESDRGGGHEAQDAEAEADTELLPGFQGEFVLFPGMNGEAIKDENDYFAYAQSQGLSVAKTAVMETINMPSDESFHALGEDFATDKIIAQWTGVMHVRIAGEYSFSTSSDDGSHLWIDGALVVSNGGLHGVETVRGTARLDAGYHDVRVDFFENEGGAAVWVKYEGPDTDGEEVLLRGQHRALTVKAITVANAEDESLANGFEARFWKDRSMDGNSIQFEGDYVEHVQAKRVPVIHTGLSNFIDLRDDAAFKTAFGGAFDVDKFVGEWTGILVVATGGLYTFSTSSDDGSHLWIDGTLVVSNEGLHPVETVSNTVRLEAGRHTVRVDFFENEGGAAIWVEYSGPDTGGDTVLLPGKHVPVSLSAPTVTAEAKESASGFQVKIWADPDMNGEEISFLDDYARFATDKGLAVTATSTSDVIHYTSDGAFHALSPGLHTDKFIAEWYGIFEVVSAGLYMFSTSSDDGSHLWIDGTLVVSNEGLHPVETVSNTVRLEAGRHTVRVDFFENEGGAAIWVEYSGPDTGGENSLLQGMHYPTTSPVSVSLPELDGTVPLPGFTTRFWYDPRMNGDEIKDQVSNPLPLLPHSALTRMTCALCRR